MLILSAFFLYCFVIYLVVLNIFSIIYYYLLYLIISIYLVFKTIWQTKFFFYMFIIGTIIFVKIHMFFTWFYMLFKMIFFLLFLMKLIGFILEKLLLIFRDYLFINTSIFNIFLFVTSFGYWSYDYNSVIRLK